MGSNTSLHPELLYSDSRFVRWHDFESHKRTPGAVCMAWFSHEEKLALVIRKSMWLKEQSRTLMDYLNFFKSTFFQWTWNLTLHNLARFADCFYGDGRGYRGNKSVTTSGFSCQAWDSQCPHKHNINGHLYQAINNSGNFCRNPGGFAKGGPWCFTTNRTVRWEHCDVPRCPKRRKYNETTWVYRNGKIYRDSEML